MVMRRNAGRSGHRRTGHAVDQGFPPGSVPQSQKQTPAASSTSVPAPRVAATSVVGRLRLGHRLYRSIITHLQDQLPGEGCGLVAWQGDRAVRIYHGSNIHHRPGTSFRMDDREVWRACEHMRARGWHLGAIYHSHPTTPPSPSVGDVANSWWPDVYSLIVSFRDRTPELRAFLIDRASASYQEVPVDIEPERGGGWRNGMPFPRRRLEQTPGTAAVPARIWLSESQTLPVLPGLAGRAGLAAPHAASPRGSMLAEDAEAGGSGRYHAGDGPLTTEMPLPLVSPVYDDWDADYGMQPLHDASVDEVETTVSRADRLVREAQAVRSAQLASAGAHAGARGLAMRVPEAERRATIGILGGMGPLATADLYRKIIELTPADSDQEHIPVVIWADPRVPDRTEALLNNGEDPTPWLVRGAQALADMGADFVVIPCNTAHAFEGPLQAAVPRPMLSMIAAAADAIVRDAPQAETVGLLATSGTIAAELYQQALLERGRDVIVPDDETQERCVMTAIRAVKAGQAHGAATALLQEAAAELVQRGAGALLAACTEIPLIFRQEHTDTVLIDATASLAEAAVATAQYLDACARDGEPVWHMHDDEVPAPVPVSAPAATTGPRRD